LSSDVDRCLAELTMNLARLGDIVRETNGHIADQNLDAAALVLGSQSGKVERFSEAWGGLQKALHEAGADPRRAAGPD
jgi:hypothetical protein